MTYADLWHSLTPLYDAREAQSIVRYVLSERFALSLTDIAGGAAERLADDELRPLMERLQEGEPVQYVLGRAMFCGRTFCVSPAVLIPRPETETLCQWVSEEYSGTLTTQPPRLLDVGTGSGCIAVTLALECPVAEVAALDISADALAVARDNARRLGAQVRFLEADILADADRLCEEGTLGEHTLSAIVSNPPYICQKERALMHANVLGHEPHTALFVPDDDPLLFYRAIARAGRRLLRQGGHLFFEINPIYSDALAAMLSNEGYANTASRPDPFGKTRCMKTTLNTHE